jgi:hypothetical protein
MKLRRWVHLAVLFAILASFGSCVVAERRAETKAKAFCSRFAVGGDFAHAIASVNAATDASKGTFEHEGEQTVFVSFNGVPPFSGHVCSIDGVNGKIIHVTYEHLD